MTRRPNRNFMMCKDDGIEVDLSPELQELVEMAANGK
jgi:hypothetical protein